MKPRIVILSAASGYGGGERSLETLLPLLAEDHEIHILAQNARHLDACRRLAAHGATLHVAVLRQRPRLLQLIYGTLWLLRAWFRLRPRFVLANNNKSAMLAALAAAAAPSLARRTVLYVRDYEWRQRGFIFARLRRALFLVPSPALFDPPDYLAPWVAPRGPSRCDVVMNAVVVPDDAPGIPAFDAPYVVLPATVQEWKGHEYVVRALAQTPSALRAVFIGDIQDRDYHARIMALAATLGISGRIAFRAFEPDILKVLSGSVCVVVASMAHAGGPETFGRTVIEGWAARRPVLAFAVGGPRYLIQDRVNGLLVPPGDADSMGRAMSELLADPAFADALGSAGYEMARDRFSPSRIHDDFRKAVNRFLA